MADETSVVNAALTKLGATRITSLTDGSTNANYAGRIYDSLRDGLLRNHNWNFATKRVELARLGTAPAYGYDYAYALPSDWLKTIEAHDNDAGVGIFDHTEEFQGTQRVIVTDADEVYLRYIYRVEDVNQWSADFVTAMEDALARDLAIPVASSNTLRKEKKEDAKGHLMAAKSTDALDAPPEKRPRGCWATVRKGKSWS